MQDHHLNIPRPSSGMVAKARDSVRLSAAIDEDSEGLSVYRRPSLTPMDDEREETPHDESDWR